MTQLLHRFSLDTARTSPQVMALAFIIWLLVLLCGILSINSRFFTSRQRWFWILTIVCLPGVGLLCYLPFSLSKDSPAKLYRGKARK